MSLGATGKLKSNEDAACKLFEAPDSPYGWSGS